MPSLSYNATVPGRGTIYFRGVADDSSSFIADASAAIYLDEQPLTQSALQPEIRLIDIERIEALPGPQGTLYGSSSQAGTLRYITNKPDPAAFTTDVALDAYTLDEGDEGYEVSGVVNIPLGETVALRVVGFSARDAGFIDNVLGTSLGGSFDNAEFVEDDINDVEYTGGRAALRWFPNENWTVDGSVVYQQMDANSYSEEDVFTKDTTSTLSWRAASSRSCASSMRAAATSGRSSPSRSRATSARPSSPRRRATSRAGSPISRTTRTTPSTSATSFGANLRRFTDPSGHPASRSASAGATGHTSTASPRNSACRARPRSSPGSTGLFYEKVEEGFSFFSRIEDYEDTVGFCGPVGLRGLLWL